MQQKDHTDKPEFEADSQFLTARFADLRRLIPLIFLIISLLPVRRIHRRWSYGATSVRFVLTVSGQA